MMDFKLEKLFWIDLEMTGLDPEREVIIEVAAIITDLQFKELDQYHTVVKQPQIFLDQMDHWNKKTHTDTGLIDKVVQGRQPNKVEDDLIQLCRKHFNPKEVIIAGNSIHQDRLFLNKYFPQFSDMLNYRMLDVSAWKIVFYSKFKQAFEKQNKHQALDDIRESIKELKFYTDFVSKT